MNHNRARRVRGQALVETVLGMIVSLAVLVAAIHFSEIGFVSLKVEEAAAAAMWQTTEGLTHHWPDNVSGQAFDQTAAIVSAVNADVQSRYQDFDGMSTSAGSSTLSQMYTDASRLTVQCAMNAPPAGGGTGAQEGTAASGVMANVYVDNGGVSCSASATVNANAFFPRAIFDRADGGFFGTSTTVFAANNFKLCGMGRASSGACQGKFTMMIDDWAGESADETGVCLILPDPAAANACSLVSTNGKRFHEAAKRMFDSSTGAVPLAGVTAGSLLAFGVVGWSPISTSYPAQNEGAFFMSVAGSEGFPKFTQPTLPVTFPFTIAHWRVQGYGTTPGAPFPISNMLTYSSAFGSRHDCFLGQSC